MIHIIRYHADINNTCTLFFHQISLLLFLLKLFVAILITANVNIHNDVKIKHRHGEKENISKKTNKKKNKKKKQTKKNKIKNQQQQTNKKNNVATCMWTLLDNVLDSQNNWFTNLVNIVPIYMNLNDGSTSCTTIRPSGVIERLRREWDFRWMGPRARILVLGSRLHHSWHLYLIYQSV